MVGLKCFTTSCFTVAYELSTISNMYGSTTVSVRFETTQWSWLLTWFYLSLGECTDWWSPVRTQVSVRRVLTVRIARVRYNSPTDTHLR